MPRRLLLLVSLGCGMARVDAADGNARIDWATIDGGGGTSSAGPWVLSGTIAQPDADVVPLCSSDAGPACVNPVFELTGGYWTGARPAPASETCGTDPGCVFRDGFEP